MLETSRLILRSFTVDDKERLFELAKNEKVAYPCGFVPHSSVAYSRDIIVRFLQKPESYAIILKEENIFIGCIGLKFNNNSVLTLGEDQAEVGYWIGELYWGREIVKEAALELFNRAFLKLRLKKIWASCMIENLRSFRLQKKLGFRYIHSKILYVPAFNEKRLAHVSCLDSKVYFKRYGF